jgi:hypothetical protein
LMKGVSSESLLNSGVCSVTATFMNLLVAIDRKVCLGCVNLCCDGPVA